MDESYDSSSQSSSGSLGSRFFIGPESKCGRAVAGLYIVLFLVILILVGTAVATGSGSSQQMSWLLFVLALLMGLVVILFLFRGKTKAKTKKRLVLLVSPVLAIFWIAALALSNAKMPQEQLAIPYIVAILFGILSVVSGISMPSEPKRRN